MKEFNFCVNIPLHHLKNCLAISSDPKHSVFFFKVNVFCSVK